MNKLNIKVTLYPDHIERNDAWVQAARVLYKIKQAIKHLEAQEEHAYAELRAFSENISSKGGNFIFTKTIRKGSVEYKLIPELQSVDLDRYRKEDTESWKLDVILK